MSKTNIFEHREKLYSNLKKEIVSKPQVYPLEGVCSPESGNKVFVIDVSRQSGSHYRGVFVHLIELLENNGVSIDKKRHPVNPNTAILVEPTTGNGGEDFIRAASELGYECHVVMPEGMPLARYRPMIELGGSEGTVIRTPTEDYAIGMRNKLAELISSNPARIDHGEKFFASPNHCCNERATVTTSLMARMIDAYVESFTSQPVKDVDLAVFAMGNGSSVLGPGKRVKELWHDEKVHCVESLASGLFFDRFCHARSLSDYKALFDIDTASYDNNQASPLMSAFSLYGTNVPLGVSLPSQDSALDGVVDDVVLVNDSRVDALHAKLIDSKIARRNARNLVFWDVVQQDLRDLGYSFGNSSAACVGVALRLLENKRDKTVLTVVYDCLDKYRD